MNNDIKLFAGNSNLPLAEAIANYLELPLGKAQIGRFPDGEANIKINEDIRGKDVFLIQSTCPPVDEHLMELLILIDCCKRSSARAVTAVMPYFGYARKDRKDEGRVPISAKVVANCLTSVGVDRVVSMDLHAGQIQGFFDIPVDHLYGSPVIGEHFLRKNLKNVVVAAPDVGGIKRARAYAGILNGALAIIDKERLSADKVAASNIIGDVEGKTVILTDDIIATGGTIVEAVKSLKAAGAGEIYVTATHAVFAGSCIERFAGLGVKEIVVTNSIPLQQKAAGLPLVYLDSSRLFGEAIKRIHDNRSVSSLFEVHKK